MAIDRVQVIKWESAAEGGDPNDDFQTPCEIEPQEDAIECRRVYLQDANNRDEEVFVDRDGDNIAFRDKVQTTPLTLTDLLGGGLTPATHRPLDQLVHEIAEDAFLEVTRTTGKVSAITYWTDAGKTLKIRDVAIARDGGGKVSQTVETQYDAAGAPIVGEVLTTTITRSSGKVVSMTMVRT